MTNDKRSSTAEGLCLANAYDVNKATSSSMTQACHENNSLPKVDDSHFYLPIT